MKETAIAIFEQLKSMNGKPTFIDTYYFSLEKILRNKNRLPTDINNGECLHISSIERSLGIPRAVFERYHPGLLQYQIFV